MKTLIIPGYSHKNKEWIDEIKEKIPECFGYEWEHWKDINLKFSLKNEVQNIKK